MQTKRGILILLKLPYWLPHARQEKNRGSKYYFPLIFKAEVIECDVFIY
jgi:hypothetical protein